MSISQALSSMDFLGAPSSVEDISKRAIKHVVLLNNVLGVERSEQLTPTGKVQETS